MLKFFSCSLGFILGCVFSVIVYGTETYPGIPIILIFLIVLLVGSHLRKGIIEDIVAGAYLGAVLPLMVATDQRLVGRTSNDARLLEYVLGFLAIVWAAQVLIYVIPSWHLYEKTTLLE